MVLPQSEVSDFVDSPLEALSFLRVGMRRGEGGGREEVGTGIAM